MADNLITTNITATANFSSLRTQLAAVTAQLIKLQETTAGTNLKLANQIAVMNKAFATTLTSTGQFSQHFVSLTSDVEKFGRNLDRGRLKLSEYYNAWSGHTKKTSNLIKDLAKQQVLLQQAIVQPVGKNAQGLMQYNVMVAKGLDEIKNKMAIARQEAAIMNKVMLDGSNQLINWGKNTQWAGRQLTVGLTVPLVAFGAAAQKAFRDADAELIRLQKVYGGLAAVSSIELAKVRKDVSETARELAGSYGVAFKDTIALAADLAATGQQGNELLEATRQTTRLAVLGEVDRQEAMKATLAIQNAFKQNTQELTESIDFLNAVENQTSTSLADLVEAIPKAGPVVKSLGGDVKDLALYLTAMKEGGVNASEGANAIKSAMASLINPTKVAKEMFLGFGIDLNQIVSSNAGDLTATILELQSALDTLDPLSKSRGIEQLFGKFQYARLSALFENLGKQGSQTVQVLDLMKASAADLASISSRELGMITESASGQFKRALAAVQADLASVGQQFLMISTKVLQIVDKIINFFKKLPEPVKNFLNALGGITAIAGPLIMLTGVMGNFIGYVIKGIFHLKQLVRGGQGFKLLTPEIVAAMEAGKGLASTFYTDTEATIVLTNAVDSLTKSFSALELKANEAKVAVQPGISTLAGAVIASGNPSGRVVDKTNPLIGEPYSRDMSHMTPSSYPQMGSIFGVVPGAGPVNVRIGKNPQSYMSTDLPKIPGVTSVNGISTGIVSQEAAKWHAMTAAIAMQSEAELKLLKAEVQATGTVTASLSDSYQALLPEFSEITELAAQETALIVQQLQQSKITADQARAKVIQLNATIEAMLAETTAKVAGNMGRTANIFTVPFSSQPAVDPVTGKSNMKEMFHKPEIKALVDKIARSLGGVKTSGAGYNIQTTVPKFAKGGIVPGTGNSDTYYTTAEPGSFVINKKSTQENMPIIQNLLGGRPIYRRIGGQVPVVLTPGEAVIPENIASEDMPLMYALNGGPGATGPRKLIGGGIREQALYNIKGAAEYVSRLSVPKNFLEDTQVRHVMHDAAILNELGMSEVESVRTAKRLYDEARQYAYDPETDTINDERMQEIKKKQTIEMDKRLGGRLIRPITKTNTGNVRAQQAILPSPKLIDTIKKLGFANVAEVDRLEKELFGNAAWDEKTRKWIPRTYQYTTEHAQKTSRWGFSSLGNFGQAMAGNKYINYWTNTFSKLTRGHDSPFEDRLPQTLAEREMAISTIAKVIGVGSGPGAIERIMKAPEKARFNFGISKDFMSFLLAKYPKYQLMSKTKRNKGGEIPGEFAQRLFGGGKTRFLGMPKSIKEVEKQRALKIAMEKADAEVASSRFADLPTVKYGEQITPTTGRSFPIPIGGVYLRDGQKVFVKPVLDEKAALAELRGTIIAREVHGLKAPEQKIVVMSDPTDPKGKRRVLALESKYDESFASMDGKFTQDDYFKQLVASALRGDKDLGRGNLSGNLLADVGTAGVFATASGVRNFSATMPSFEQQAYINLLGVKGSSAKRFFAESTLDIPRGMTADQYHERMLSEINAALPKLKQTIARFDLNAEEKVMYDAMIRRLSDARKANYKELHGVHSSVSPSVDRPMTPAALAKIMAANELKRRQSGEAVSLSDNAFKTDGNGFALGGLIHRLEKREKGGPVSANTPYVVGERGPELFVPRMNGGIIPGAMPMGYFGGGMVKLMLMQMLGMYGGQALGKSLAGDAGSQIGMFLGSMLGMGSMAGAGGAKAPMTAKGRFTTPIGMTKMVAPMDGAIGPSNKVLTAAGAKVEAYAASTNKLKNIAAFAAKSLTRLNLAVAVVAAGVGFGINRFKAYQESMRLNALGYGMTAEAASKAGLKFTSFSSKIKEAVDNVTALKERNAMLYDSMKSSGTPLDITIEQYKKLKKEVKENFSDQIALINKTSAKDQTDLAVRLKEQLIAMGLSAEEATKKIYAMYASSNFAANASKFTVGSEKFNKIKDSATAAISAINSLNRAMATDRDPTEQANQLNTAMMALSTDLEKRQQDAIKAAKKQAIKDGTYFSTGDERKIMIEQEEAAIQEINNKVQNQVILTKEVVDELAKIDPSIRRIVNEQETSLSLWQKTRIALKGYTGDLRSLNAEQTNDLYNLQIALSKSVEAANRSKGGLLEKQYAQLDKNKALQAAYEKAAKGQSAAQQIRDRDRISALQKQIDETNKLADARIKALNVAKQEGDLARELAIKQAEYQSALARGDSAGAQVLGLEMEGITEEIQYNAQVKSIEEARDAKIGPLQKQIEAIQKNQQKISDTAAIASEKLTDLSKTITDQETALDELNKAQVNYLIELAKQTDATKVSWKTSKEAERLLSAVGQAAEDAGVKLKGLKDIDLGRALTDGLQNIASSSFSLSGDVTIYINGKKFNIGNDGDGTRSDPFNAGTVSGAINSVVNTFNTAQSLAYGTAVATGAARKNQTSLDSLNWSSTFGNYSDSQMVKKYALMMGYLKGEFFKLQNRDGSYANFRVLDDSGNVQLLPVKRHHGGPVHGPGTATSDSIPAYLSDGEYVVRAAAVDHYGVDTMNLINAKKFKDGGQVKADGNFFSRFNPVNMFSSMLDGFKSFGLSQTSNKNIKYKSNISQTEKDLILLQTAQALSGYTSAFNLKNNTSPEVFGKKGIGQALDVLALLPAVGITSKLTLSKINQLKKQSKNRITDSKEMIIMEDGETIIPSYKMGNEKFAFQGFGENVPDLSDFGVTTVPINPIGILQAALKIKPNNKKTQSLLDNFTNNNIGKSELEFLDNMSASISFGNKAEKLGAEDADGLVDLINALNGNKSASELISLKTQAMIKTVDEAKIKRENELKESEDFYKRLAGVQADSSKVPVIHSTKFPTVRDADGNINLYPYGHYNVGKATKVDDAGNIVEQGGYPRASLHFTLEDSVKSHIMGQWDPDQVKIVSPLSSMMNKNGKPYNLNVTDTWWMRNPGQPLTIPNPAIIRPYVDAAKYKDELVKRGLINADQEPPLLVVDSKTKDVLHLLKNKYSDEDMDWFRSNGYSESQATSSSMETIALQEAKKLLGIDSSPVTLEQWSLSNAKRQDLIYKLNEELGLSGEIHSGSYPEMLERALRESYLREGFGSSYTHLGSPSIEALRMLMLHGITKSGGKKIDLASIGLNFANGGYVNPTYSANMSMPRYHNLNGRVPGPYGQEVTAILQAGKEGVYQEPYINQLKNDTMGNITINNNINGYDGDMHQLSRMVTQQTIVAIKALDNRVSSTIGPKMNVSISG